MMTGPRAMIPHHNHLYQGTHLPTRLYLLNTATVERMRSSNHLVHIIVGYAALYVLLLIDNMSVLSRYLRTVYTHVRSSLPVDRPMCRGWKPAGNARTQSKQ